VRVAGRGPAQDRDALAGNALLVSINASTRRSRNTNRELFTGRAGAAKRSWRQSSKRTKAAKEARKAERQCLGKTGGSELE
jgi:hypothetical protein